MTTKKARLRKTKRILGKTASGSRNTRARRKALKAKRMAIAAAEEAAAAIKGYAKSLPVTKKKQSKAWKAAPPKKG